MTTKAGKNRKVHSAAEAVAVADDLDRWLAPYWSVATPGLSLEVYQGQQKIFNYRGGESYLFYDLASLTKVLFTVPSMMLAMQERCWNMETRVVEHLPWWPHSSTKIVDLLRHSSGLLWWKAFFKELVEEPSTARRWERLKEDLIKTPLDVQTKSVYSDLGFLTLAYLLQSFWSESLDNIWKRVKQEFAPQSQLHWRSSQSNLNDSSRDDLSLYAPTEMCVWRQRRIQGEVHDENAWALGGLSTHAGLFGSPSDVASVFLMFRRIREDKAHPLHATLDLFSQRQLSPAQGDWAMGLMLPTQGGSSSGKYFSSSSLGHTGFTGTSVWWDYEHDRLVVVLSNRIFYGRDQKEFIKLRPLIHDKLIEKLM